MIEYGGGMLARVHPGFAHHTAHRDCKVRLTSDISHPASWHRARDTPRVTTQPLEWSRGGDNIPWLSININQCLQQTEHNNQTHPHHVTCHTAHTNNSEGTDLYSNPLHIINCEHLSWSSILLLSPNLYPDDTWQQQAPGFRGAQSTERKIVWILFVKWKHSLDQWVSFTDTENLLKFVGCVLALAGLGWN